MPGSGVVVLILATDRPLHGNSPISPEPIRQMLDNRLGGKGS